MTSGAASLLSELSPGGNGMGLASMAAQGLGSLSGWARQSGAATSALGPGQASAPNSVADAGMLASLGRGAMSFLGTGAGVAAAGVGAAASAGMLYQMGGEVVQGYRSMGQTRGGGFQEGLGYEMAIRAQPLSAQVLTPQGWMKMGDLSPGDQVISGEGTSTTVLKVYDHGVRDVYEVQFDDGSTTRCTLDHLWAVYTQNNDLRVMRFEDMIGGKRKNEYGLTRKCGRPRYRVPLPEPINFEKKVFPVDPYTLGILLGDGSHSQHYVGLTCFEDEVYDMALPPGVNLKKVNNKKGGTYYFQGQGQGAPNPMVSAMKEIGLMGVACRDKFIPEPYLFGSVEQRLALLQGLMDTDGYISASDGRAFFTNSSPRLIDGVRSLVLSLGGKAKVFTFPEKVSMIKGEEVSTKISYKMEIRLPSALGAPVRLSRKVDVYRAAHHKVRATSTRQIVSARQVTSESCRCIYIDHPGHLYVTDEYIVTHNSMAMNPFITTDQARQIVSAGLSSGYTGKEFDTLTQFIAANLKDMNMSVADSMKMFKKNVTEGGVSAEGVSGALETLKVGSRQGYSSLETMTAGYANTSSAFINAGMSGPQASRAAAASTFVLNDSAELAGLYSSIASSAAGDKKIGGLLMNPSISGQNMPMGTTPESAWERISGDPNQAIYNILRYFAQLAWQGSGGDEGIAVSSFHSMLKQNFPQVDWQSRTKVRALLKEVLSNPNAIKNANSQEKQAGKEAAAAKPLGTMQRLGANISGNLQTGVAAVTDLFKNVFTRSPEEGWNWDETIRSSEQWQMGVNEVRSPMLSTLVNQTQGGSKNLQVGDGKSWQQLDLANVEQIKALSDGKMKIRERGDTSGGKYLTEIPNSGKNGINGVIQTTPVYGKLEVTVHQNGKVDAPQTVQLSPAQQGAMEGVGGFYPNTAPPGDPRRGAYG